MNPLHFFLSSDGTLYDTRPSPMRMIRGNYRCTHRVINNTLDLRATLRAGKYTTYGCYPLALHTLDGETLCFDCAKEEYRNVSAAIRHKLNDGWRIAYCEVNYEDPDMQCAHCNERIESAYADNEENDNGHTEEYPNEHCSNPQN